MPQIVELCEGAPIAKLEYYFSREYTQMRRDVERCFGTKNTSNHRTYTPAAAAAAPTPATPTPPRTRPAPTPPTPATPTPPRTRPAPSPAARARAPPPPDPVPPIPIDPTKLSATTLPLLRPEVLTDPQPFAISSQLTSLIIVTPAKSCAYPRVFKSFANPGLVSNGRKFPRDAWTLNGEPVAQETVQRAIQEVCVAVLRRINEPRYTKQLQRAQRSIATPTRIRDIECCLRGIMTKEEAEL
ncbi:hypothetical protein HK102_006135 [Quaeritorhiza haematococci]|nr:hypothetical protein HK102_006135 [Quaeritorhiza haematococci]